ncbi:uncharacterized protein [Fopius arisanus]|uniref:Uncharacterized protein isoform X2 n=1 Tax=Fopius arisanus TaxID=64838 RepID=A0A9R1T7J8_9HYME|nr:PREDICTED: uncharacterized protein LOC105267279 isoform X2 [Fopius arisanus]
MSEISSSNESTDEEEVDRNFEAEARLIVETDTLPKKSAERYMLVYEAYNKWKVENKSALSQSEESNLIVYFKGLSQRLSPNTLWSIHSMLKTTLNTKNNIDINKFYKLKSLIKTNSKGHKPKKSLVLTWNEVIEFLTNAPDHVYLASKVILIFGICGATRCEELKELKVDDVQDLGGKYLVSINDTKNDLPRKFLIGDLFYERVRKYILLKPADFDTTRFFIQYHNELQLHCYLTPEQTVLCSSN